MTRQTQRPDVRPWGTASDYLNRPEYAEQAAALAGRNDMVTAMTRHAEAHGLMVTKEFVSRHYTWFYRWHCGIIATGYLRNRTGVKQRTQHTDTGRWM